MKTYIKTIIAVPLLAMATFTFAGNKEFCNEIPEKLGLNAAQAEAFKAVMSEKREKLDSLEKSKESKKAVREETRAKLAEILTPEQMDTLKELRSEHGKKGGHKGKKGQRPHGDSRA